MAYPAEYNLRLALPEHYRAVWQMISDAYDVPGVTRAGTKGSRKHFWCWLYKNFGNIM